MLRRARWKIVFSARQVAAAFRGLSTLGRMQILILLLNLLGSFLVINLISSDRHRRLDSISLYFGLEFILFSAISIAYTVTVENTAAFYGLIFLQLEVAAFITVSAWIGVLSQVPAWARAVVVGINWLALGAFLALQRIVRRSWGWHAYHVVGGNPAAVRAFEQYQRFTAALLIDCFHAVLFFTAEAAIAVLREGATRFVVYALPLAALLLARPLQLMVRSEARRLVVAMFLLYTGVLGLYLYFAIMHTQDAILHLTRVVDDNDDISTQGERNLVACVEWCVVVVRLFLLMALARVSASVFGTARLPQLFPSGRHDATVYLVGDDEIQGTRARLSSVGSGLAAAGHYGASDAHAAQAGGGPSPAMQPPARSIKVFDMTHRTASIHDAASLVRRGAAPRSSDGTTRTEPSGQVAAAAGVNGGGGKDKDDKDDDDDDDIKAANSPTGSIPMVPSERDLS